MFRVYVKKSGMKKNKEATIKVVNFKAEPQKLVAEL